LGDTLAGLLDWIKKLTTSGRNSKNRRPEPTLVGTYSVVLQDLGTDQRTIVDILQMISPLEPKQLNVAVEKLPFTVRKGLTKMAASSIRDRLNAAGADITIHDSSVTTAK
jgi:ribosomal protein L7/L12